MTAWLRRARRRPTWMLILAGAVAMVVAGAAVVAAVALRPLGGPRLAAWDTLDQRWGTYLPERQWGTVREASTADPWAFDYPAAIGRDYAHGEDGIAAFSNRDGTFAIGWALWDEEQPWVTERPDGWGRPEAAHGEQIAERRVFGPTNVTSSYNEYRLAFPAHQPRFSVRLEGARADERSGVMLATVERLATAAPAPMPSGFATPTPVPEFLPLQLVVKGWLQDPAFEAELSPYGLLLHGHDSVVAVVAPQPNGAQVSDDKAALDANLRGDGLRGGGPGHIGALAFWFQLGASGRDDLPVAWAEAADADTAIERARELLPEVRDVVEWRRNETEDLLRGEVREHAGVYRQALMSLLWNRTLYRWDGASAAAPGWSGRIGADDVVVVPDPWEYPYPRSWESAFIAVSAALIDPQLAADQLRFILSERWQQADGHIPCSELDLDAECPPVLSWAAWRVHEAGAENGFLAEIFAALEANHRYWQDELTVADGLYTGGSLGMENLPRGDNRAQADASAWMAFSARHLALIADEMGDASAADDYRAQVDEIGAAVNAELWDPDTGFYYDLGDDGEPIREKSYSGLVPLIAGIVPDDRVERMLEALRDGEQLLSPVGIRSLSAASDLYQPGYASQWQVNANWRGPVWVPLNYLLVEALEPHDPAFAAEVRRRLVEIVERNWQGSGRFHEFFDADTGAGLGADANAGWTALVANLVREGWPAD